MALDVLILHNRPELAPDDPDAASEAGVMESVEAVDAALRSAGCKTRRFGASASVDELLDVLRGQRPDVVFNLFEGFGGVGRGEAQVAGVCELLGLPLTGSPSHCLGLVRDKPRTKWLLSGAGLPTPKFELLLPDDSISDDRLARLLAHGPAIVKPAHEDASLGIDFNSVRSDIQGLRIQILHVRQRYGAVLVERFIAGREFNVAIVASPAPRVLPLAEIAFDRSLPTDHRIVTYEAKWSPASRADLATPVHCPADVEPWLAKKIERVALDAFSATGCQDYARVDVRVSDAGDVYVLEINGNPDIGPSAGFAKALRAAGWDYAPFIIQLAQQAATKNPRSD